MNFSPEFPSSISIPNSPPGAVYSPATTNITGGGIVNIDVDYNATQINLLDGELYLNGTTTTEGLELGLPSGYVALGGNGTTTVKWTIYLGSRRYNM